jgi:NitT/TauT family transport system substrate-binding protein
MKKQLVYLLLVCVLGCGNQNNKKQQNDPIPSFTLAISEYPSWVVFDVASEKGLIDGTQGKLGPIEKKWGVDIVLKLTDYDTCITMFGSKTVDAACLTSLDALAPSLGRKSVAVLPTSTSVGADACIVVNGGDLDSLKNTPTYGLEKSVSQYAFERNLELKGKNPKDYVFKNMDPAAAAQAVQTNQKNVESIMVWNPFVLQTLRTRTGSSVLFDSSTIPEEIIDCVIVGQDSLDREKGENFACAVIDAYYEVNKLLANPTKHDSTLTALGAKFSSLGLEDMKLVVEQTKFYSTSKEGLQLFSSEKFRNETMPSVVNFCVLHDIVPKSDSIELRIGFNDERALLNFSTKYLLMYDAAVR